MEFLKAYLPEHLAVVREIAHQTWPVTFKNILSPEQMGYMLEAMYSQQILEEQWASGAQHFILALEKEHYQGFASYVHHYKQSDHTKIHKLYLLPSAQGKQLGRKFIEFIAQSALQNQDVGLTLNVNRFNPALNFYEKLGFRKVREEQLPIGPYRMDDFVMERQLIA